MAEAFEPEEIVIGFAIFLGTKFVVARAEGLVAGFAEREGGVELALDTDWVENSISVRVSTRAGMNAKRRRAHAHVMSAGR